MENIKFSVSMCVYGKDNSEWFYTAVNSILNQTCPPSEVILVVDGPVPEELDLVIRNFEELPAFKVIRFSENRGHGDARREGLKYCSNELVAIMDADDISISNRFEKQLKAFSKDPELSIVGGQITEFVGKPGYSLGMRTVFCDDGSIKNDLRQHRTEKYCVEEAKVV